MSTISASTLTTTAFQIAADTTGALVFQTGATPTTALTLAADQSATFAGTVNFATAGFTSLSISGNLTFTGTGNRILGDFSNATVASRVAFQSSTTNGYTALMAAPNGTGTASYYIANNSSDIANASYGYIGALSTDVRLVSSYSGTGSYLPMTFYTGGSERMRITSGGYVGINTTGGQQTFAVKQISADNGIAVINSADDARLYINSTGSVWNISATVGGSGSYQPIAFKTSDTERMRIDASGNVGIGVTSVTGAKLDVNGGIVVGGALTVNQTDRAFIEYASNVANFGAYGATAGTGAVRFSTGGGGGGGGTERMRIDSSGNVLIGVSSTVNSERLSVAKSSAVTTDPFIGGAITVALRNTSNTAGNSTSIENFDTVGGNAYIRFINVDQNYASAITFGTATAGAANYGERMRIDSVGNVGIGTSGPAFKLDVYRGSSGVVLNLQGVDAYSAETGLTFSSQRAKISGFLNGSGGTPGSTLRFYTMPDGGSVTEVMRLGSAGELQFNSGYGSVATAYGCRAWVKFNGSTGTIAGSGNVTSVTKNSNGRYNLNLTNAMPDTNYMVQVAVGAPLGGSNIAGLGNKDQSYTSTTSAVYVGTVLGSNANTYTDYTEIYVGVWR